MGKNSTKCDTITQKHKPLPKMNFFASDSNQSKNEFIPVASPLPQTRRLRRYHDKLVRDVNFNIYKAKY